jgi:hypothetical protein
VSIWRSLAIFGDLWRSLAIFGDLWRSLAIFGDLSRRYAPLRASADQSGSEGNGDT